MSCRKKNSTHSLNIDAQEKITAKRYQIRRGIRALSLEEAKDLMKNRGLWLKLTKIA